jgi:hypothetical protein
MPKPTFNHFTDSNGAHHDECLCFYLQRHLIQLRCKGAPVWTCEWIRTYVPPDQQAETIDELERLDCCDCEFLFTLLQEFSCEDFDGQEAPAR